MNEKRKGTRREAAFEKRKIPVNMSPATPLVKRMKRSIEEKVPEPDPIDAAVKERHEKLLKYKADKLRKKEEAKKNAKPRFLVTHINVSVGLPDLENVNKEIKGKKFISKFAPSNHQFKPPANIKPLQFENSNKKSIVKKPQQQQAYQIKTRSKGPAVIRSPIKKVITRGKENRNKNIATKLDDTSEKEKNSKKVDKTLQKKSTSIKLNTLKEKTPNKLDSSLLLSKNVINLKDNDIQTPKKNEDEAPVYISPFVTVSRGKQNARKEYEARRSGKSFHSEKSDTAECISPKAGAKYFTWILNKEISRLEGLCDQWNEYKVEETVSEEAASMIDVATGQAKLFITKKCDQFRGLISKCIENDTETPVTCEDLHGFWDMMLIQVKNLNLRFENLDNLKANDWEEIRPEVITKPVKSRGRPKKKVAATSTLKAAIEAARKQKQIDNNVAEGGTCILKSNTLSAVQGSGKKRISSPGLTIMKIAQYAKNATTPGKGILKPESVRRTKSHNKSVIFFDDMEDDLNKSTSKRKTPSRQSARLSRTKLF